MIICLCFISQLTLYENDECDDSQQFDTNVIDMKCQQCSVLSLRDFVLDTFSLQVIDY